ncbi:hypothetical protein EJB05_31931, partial [Eragrostis curvula]
MQAGSAGAGAGASDPGPSSDDPAAPRIEEAGVVPVQRDSGAERDAGVGRGVPGAAMEASCTASGASPLATGRSPAEAAQDAGRAGGLAGAKRELRSGSKVESMSTQASVV